MATLHIWERAADDTVAILRTEAGRNPYDRDLSDLVGELSTRSEELRTRWAADNVRIHRTGAKEFHHSTSSRAGPQRSTRPTWLRGRRERCKDQLNS